MKRYQISDQADLDPIHKDAFKRKHDETLAFIEGTKFGLSQSVLNLPLEAQIEPDPPSPDVLISDHRASIGIEVTRVTWQRLSEVRRHAKPGEIVELNKNLLVDKEARKGRKASKDQRSGDYRAIKGANQQLDGAGYLGGEDDDEMFKALTRAIERKSKKVHGYKKNVHRVWLFLIDDGLPISWKDIITNNMQKLNIMCRSSGFEQILLFEFGSGVSQLYGDRAFGSPT